MEPTNLLTESFATLSPHACTHTHTHTHSTQTTHAHTDKTYTRTRTHMHTHTNTHRPEQICTHLHTHTHTHTRKTLFHTNAHTHTHIHTFEGVKVVSHKGAPQRWCQETLREQAGKRSCARAPVHHHWSMIWSAGMGAVTVQEAFQILFSPVILGQSSVDWTTFTSATAWLVALLPSYPCLYDTCEILLPPPAAGIPALAARSSSFKMSFL